MPGPRTTLKEIAEKAGVSTMTVSRALRDHPEVGRRTRERIRAIAAAMDYRPDPALAALASYRKNLTTMRDYGTIAFVTDFETAVAWRDTWTFAEYFAGAGERATALGYKLEPFWINSRRLDWRRASDVLYHRGIRGLLIAPLPNGQGTLKLKWELFSAVALGRSLVEPLLHTVSPNQPQTVALACAELRRRGYTRVGLAITQSDDDRTDHSYVAYYLREQNQALIANLPVHITDAWDPAKLQRWIKEYRLDAIIAPDPELYNILVGRLKLRVPGSLGFAALNAPPDGKLTGSEQGLRQVGAGGIDLLNLKMQRNEAGVPVRRESLLIESVWHEGRTAKPDTSSRPARGTSA